jgi:hypothetical protein
VVIRRGKTGGDELPTTQGLRRGQVLWVVKVHSKGERSSRGLEGSRFGRCLVMSGILCIARKAKGDVKQAAPANYRTRCFAHRWVGMIDPGECQQS